jgi:AcrR family transcriptional regulator
VSAHYTKKDRDATIANPVGSQVQVNMPAMGKILKKTIKNVKVSRKAQMVVAAEALLRQRGLGGVTTRAIAEAVPCSEGAIYVHFKDRLELLLAVLQECLPEMLVPLHALQERVGRGTPRKNLEIALAGLMRFHDRVAPMLCSLIMEPELLHRFRESLNTAGKGPHRGIATLAHYIEQEQKIGRIETRLDAKTAASVVMASSFFHIFTSKLLGSDSKLDVKRLIDFAIQSSDATKNGQQITE